MTRQPPISTPATEAPAPADETTPAASQTGDALCPTCNGSGWMEDRPCPDCGGSGRITVTLGDA